MNPSLTDRVEDGDESMNFGSIPNISLGDMEAAISVINEPDILESEAESHREAQKEDITDSTQANSYEEYEDWTEDEEEQQYVEDEQQSQYVEDEQFNEDEPQEEIQEVTPVQQSVNNVGEDGYEEWTEEDEANYQEQYTQEDEVLNDDNETGEIEPIQSSVVEQPNQSTTSYEEYEEWTEEDEANYHEDEEDTQTDDKLQVTPVVATVQNPVVAEQKANDSTDEYEEWTEEDEANYVGEEGESEDDFDNIELDEEFEQDTEDETPEPVSVRQEVPQQKQVTSVKVEQTPSEKEIALKKKIEQMELEEQQRKRELALELQLQEKKRQAEEDKKKLDELARQRSQAQMVNKHPAMQPRPAQAINQQRPVQTNIQQPRPMQQPVQQRLQQPVRPPVQQVRPQAPASSQPIANKSVNKIERYNSLDLVNLWEEVRKFMEANGVMTRAIPEKLLTDEFGAENVKKLYKKGYIIPFAGKRVTIG